jgi:mannose-6-phosphate isomerase
MLVEQLELQADAVGQPARATPDDDRVDELMELVDAQNVGRFLEEMNRLPVTPGDTIYVPAGVPHVIGAGILLLELQEPADLSLLLEWKGWAAERDAFLDLPRALVLGAVDRAASDLRQLTSRRGARLFPSKADRFFRAEIVTGGGRLEPAFSVVIVIDGEGELQPANAESLRVRRGTVLLVPFASGEVDVLGGCRAVRCRPPLPE